MSDEAALLRAVIEEPEDDLPRLAYADWLDERGDARRAELIRVQCRLAALDELDPQWPDLHDREWELLTVYERRWRPNILWLRSADNRSGFVRGFHGRCCFYANALVESGDEIARATSLEQLRITSLEGRLGVIAARPWMAGVTSLELTSETITEQELRALTESPHLGRLRRLLLYNVTLPADGVQRLSRWPALRRLTHLAISHPKNSPPAPGWLRPLLEATEALTNLMVGKALHEDDVAWIASTPRLASLRRLDVGLTTQTAALLAAATGLPALRHLDVGWGNQDDEGNAALLASPLLARLESLDLSSTTFGPRSAAALADSPHLARLRRLVLLQCNVGPEEAKAIARARFGAITELNLYNDHVGRDGMAALAHSPHLAGLTKLDLMDNNIRPEGAADLARSPILPNLRSLDLSRCFIGADGARALTAAPLPRLRHLGLWLCNLGAKGCRQVLLSENLAGLWALDVSDNTFTDATAKAVAAATPLGQLRRLGVGDLRGPSQEGWRTLAASPRLPDLLWLSRAPFREGTRSVSEALLEQGKGREL